MSFFKVHGWFWLWSLVWYTMAVKRVLWISLKPLMGGLVFSPFHWGWGGVGWGKRIEQCKKLCMEFQILPCGRHTYLLLDAMPCRASFCLHQRIQGLHLLYSSSLLSHRNRIENSISRSRYTSSILWKNEERNDLGHAGCIWYWIQLEGTEWMNPIMSLGCLHDGRQTSWLVWLIRRLVGL